MTVNKLFDLHPGLDCEIDYYLGTFTTFSLSSELLPLISNQWRLTMLILLTNAH